MGEHPEAGGRGGVCLAPCPWCRRAGTFDLSALAAPTPRCSSKICHKTVGRWVVGKMKACLKKKKSRAPPRPQGLWEGGAQERLVRAPVGLSIPQLSP